MRQRIDAAPTPGQTVGPFFGFALPYAGGTELVAAGAPGRDPPARHGARRRTATRCPTPCSRSGRPTRTAGRRSDAGLAAPRRLHLHRLGPRARPTATGRYSFTTRAPGRDEPERRRSSRSPSSPAGCWTGCSPGSTCPTTPLLAADPLLSSVPTDRRATLVAADDADGSRASTSGCRASGRPSSSPIARGLSAWPTCFWPGDERAGDVFGRGRPAPRWCASSRPGWRAGRRRRRPGRSVRADLGALVGRGGPRALAGAARGRRQPRHPAARPAARPSCDDPEAGRWLHRGLTSQDVLDTALMLVRARRRRAASRVDLDAQVGRARRRWPSEHRDTLMAGAHPDPARRADHLRPQGRAVARTACSTRATQLAGRAAPVAARRRRRHPRRHRRAGAARRRAEPVAATRSVVTEAAASWSSRAALAHHPRRRHPPRRRPGRAPPTPGAGSPTTCSCSAAPRSASWPSRRRPRRLVDDAAQGEPGARPCWCAGPRSPPRPAAPAAPGRRRAGRRARRRRLARRVGDAARRWRGAPLAAASQTTELLAGLQVDADRWPRTPMPPASRPARRAARDGRASAASRSTGARRRTCGATDALVDAVLDARTAPEAPA